MRALHDLVAPAKLNLFLHIVGRRADGYHLLQSVFILIDWCDTLHMERRDDGHVQRHDVGTSLPADDLCVRAARALQAASATHWGVDMHLEKRIPQGAGLGGGSSDAATTLLALNTLWDLHWPRERLAELALGIGADVPFFIFGQPAWAEGVGERLTPLTGSLALPQPWLDAAYVVIKPPQSIATATLFTAQELKRDTKPAIISDFLAAASSVEALQAVMGQPAMGQSASALALRSTPAPQGVAQETPFATRAAPLFLPWRNDLQPAAQVHCPPVQEAVQWLDRRFGNSRMTGSGSAVFSVVMHAASDRAAQSALSELPAGWKGRVCHALREHPLRQALG